MRAMIPLTDDEQAAVDDGDAARSGLLDRLADTPHASRANAPAARPADQCDQPRPIIDVRQA